MPAKAGSASAQDDTDWSMASSRARSSRSDRDSRTASGGHLGRGLCMLGCSSAEQAAVHDLLCCATAHQ